MVAQGASRRQTRVGESIREELSRSLLRHVEDPRLAWVTVTDIEVSPDLKNARVFYVITGGETEKIAVERSLKKATPFLQGVLSRNLKLRFTPKLNFIFDDSFDKAERIDQLIHEVQHDTSNDNNTSQEVRFAKLVSDANRILVFTHKNPDGDAIGSLLGFSRILRLMGKSPTVYCPDGIPNVLDFLSEGDEVLGALPSLDEPFELSVCLDTADEGLFPDNLPARDQMGTLVVIDHHEIHGSVGDLVIRRATSSVGELLFYLHKELVWPMDARIAECLYTSIVADTGSFRYSNTTPETHQAAAALVAAGARSWVVATALFESYPISRQRLLAAVLRTLTVSCNDKYAFLWCTPEMLDAASATKQDLDNVINFARAIDTVKVAAMFRQEPSGDIKISFRSKEEYDVARLAATYGGGGHKNAAGCTLKETSIEDAQNRVNKAVESLIEKTATKGDA